MTATRRKNYGSNLSLVPFKQSMNKKLNLQLKNIKAQVPVVSELENAMIKKLELNTQMNKERMLFTQDIIMTLFQLGVSTIPAAIARMTRQRYNMTINNHNKRIEEAEYLYNNAFGFLSSLSPGAKLLSMNITKQFMTYAKLANVTVFEFIAYMFVITTVLITIINLSMRRKKITLIGIENKR